MAVKIHCTCMSCLKKKGFFKTLRIIDTFIHPCACTLQPVLHLEMKFPKDYPMSPPFVRIIRPRFQFHTGTPIIIIYAPVCSSSDLTSSTIGICVSMQSWQHHTSLVVLLVYVLVCNYRQAFTGSTIGIMYLSVWQAFTGSTIGTHVHMLQHR